MDIEAENQQVQEQQQVEQKEQQVDTQNINQNLEDKIEIEQNNEQKEIEQNNNVEKNQENQNEEETDKKGKKVYEKNRNLQDQKFKKKRAEEATEDDKSVELKICKYLDLQPSTILSIATHVLKKVVLIGRNDGTIELWKLSTKTCIWQQQLEKYIIPQRIVWLSSNMINLEEDYEFLAEDEFLYDFIVCSQNGSLLLYNMNKSSLPLHWYSTQSRIWDAKIYNGQLLTSHEDGTVKLFNFEEDHKIRLKNSSPPSHVRCVSACFNKVESDGLFLSFADGHINKCNKNFQVQSQIKCEKRVFAWQLLHTQNDILIAGCNEGSVLFFETKFGTLLKSFKKHEADILQMALHPTFPKLYCTGSDSKVAVFDVSSKNVQFLQEFRGQSHDIFALDFISDDSFATGGYTTDFCVYYLQQGVFQEKKHTISLQTQDNKIYYNQKQQLVTVQKPASLEIYEMDSQNYRLNIQLNSKQTITSCFQVGCYLGYTNSQETFVFRIENKTQLKKEFYRQEGYKKIAFSLQNRQLIAISENNQLLKININQKQENKSENSKINEEIIAILEESLYNPQHLIIGNKDNSVIVGSSISNTIIEYSLTEEDTILYEVPNLFDKKEISYTVLKYFSSTNQLIVVYENKKFGIFDMQGKKLSNYSKNNFQRIPSTFLKSQGPILNVVPHPKIKKRLVFYGAYYYLVLDLTQSFLGLRSIKEIKQRKENKNQQLENDKNNGIEIEQDKQKKGNTKGDVLTLVKTKKPILGIRNHEQNLVVFETDFNNMIANLAEPVVSKKFNI